MNPGAKMFRSGARAALNNLSLVNKTNFPNSHAGLVSAMRLAFYD